VLPWVVAGAGTAFAFIPISKQLGGALGIAIASSVAGAHTKALLDAGDALPTALTGGFQRALWVLGGIALIALPAIFALLRRDELSDAVSKLTSREPPALATTA
jgi:hypothetical protein